VRGRIPPDEQQVGSAIGRILRRVERIDQPPVVRPARGQRRTTQPERAALIRLPGTAAARPEREPSGTAAAIQNPDYPSRGVGVPPSLSSLTMHEHAPGEAPRFDTLAIHAGELHPRPGGAGILPIHLSTVFEHRFDDDGAASVVYPRLSNLPNHEVLQRKLAALEGAEDAVVTTSGMAAISTALLATLRAGDHLLAIDAVYGGTFALLRDVLPDLGIETTHVPLDDPAAWREALRPNTRAFWSEALTNPLVRVPDHEGLVAFAREHGLTSLIDATFASPINFRPLELGYDVVVHSATKYLNGHSDICAGVVASDAARIERIAHRLDLLGGSLDAHACFLLHRGLRTLALRVERQNANALALAQALTEDAAVARVHYPGLPGHRDHERASKLFSSVGGVLAFEPARARAEDVLRRLRIAIPAPSLGGVETLATTPRISTHVALSPEERARMGIPEDLIRVAVGIENEIDLVQDFRQALAE
jgi:cystathionine beta-lyase/cystathionine gamma-synthase